MRIDKYLWCVRIFKTRSLAAAFCRKGKVKVNGAEAKPGKEVTTNDRIEVRKTPIVYQYRVVDIPKSRVGAKLVEDFLIDLTPEEQLAILRDIQKVNREGKTKGRPTKRERRNLDKFKKGL